MSTGPQPPTPFRLTAAVALKRVRELAANSSSITWTKHVQERMVLRSFDVDDVFKILRTGEVESDPVQGPKQGEWKFKLTQKMTNGRVAGLVVLLTTDNRMKLLTVEWEDYR